jgi:adenylosuccinate synthase
VAYRYQDQILNEFPDNINILKDCEPVYIEMPGWEQDITGITCFEDLPANTQAYIHKIEEILPVKEIFARIIREVDEI